jgi:Kef-type K+ transport system membrane component KefB
MSDSARSVFVFGIYLVILGIVLLIAPNILLGLLGLPSTHEVWIRISGMLLLFLAFYYIQAARKELKPFIQWTVYIRSTIIFFFVAFVLLGFVSPVLILPGIVDLLGAIWTGLALRSSQNVTSASAEQSGNFNR